MFEPGLEPRRARAVVIVDVDAATTGCEVMLLKLDVTVGYGGHVLPVSVLLVVAFTGTATSPLQ